MSEHKMLRFSDRFLRRLFIVLAIMLALAIIGIVDRIVAYIKLRHVTEQNAILPVAVTKAAVSPTTEEVILPGNVQAWHAATIYARTNGYAVNWFVDIGAHVTAGDVLATIASPEVDAQLRQAEADLKTAEANNQIAQTTAIRWQSLLKTNAVSEQETEEKVSTATATAAIVKATTANRDRLRELVSFERIVAPFTGIISARTTDVGQLINAGSTGNVPLFHIVQVDPLRVYVRIPQYYASRIAPGMMANLYFPEHPEKSYQAKLLDTAKAIDAQTRTLLAEFVVDNPNKELLSGSYTEVHLQMAGNSHAVRLPINTLIFRKENMQVAVIDHDHTVVLKPITLGRDYGDSVEVVAGIKAGEAIILNPPDALMTGQEVHIVTPRQEDSL